MTTSTQKGSTSSHRFRQLRSRLDQEPTPAEVEVFIAVAAHLTQEKSLLPRFVVSGRAVIAVVPTLDAEGLPCMGLVVDLSA